MQNHVAGARRPSSAPSSPQRTIAVPAPAQRVAAALAPAGSQPQPKPESSLLKPQPRSLRGTLSGLFNRWDSRAPPESVQALVEATSVAQQQADALDEARERGGGDSGMKGEEGLLPDIRAFLRPVGVLEARYVRMLSSLSALTYGLDNLTPSSLMRRHRLKLVSTSKVCDARLREPRRSAADAVAEGDAMAGDPAIVSAAQAEIAAGEARALAAPTAAMAAVARVAPLSTLQSVDLVAAASGQAPSAGAAASSGAVRPSAGNEEATQGLSPVDRVAASLAAAAAAASAAAQGAYTAAVPYAGPLANNITAFTTSALTSALPPVRSVAAQLQNAAAAGHSSAIATVATVTAALESTWSGRSGSSRLPKECQSPTEWFIADDPATHTRYFVIQGSDNLDHWRVNLTFDPVLFEDPALGVKVHRGVYETAAVLYDRFLPLVQDHLATSPFAKVAFTGHSLGGSLGTVLMLMYVRRGVLPKSAISPVYTFGAPAVFCEGSARACDCQSAEGGSMAGSAGPAAQHTACGVGSGKGVLSQLSLPDGAVRNVVMHRDIVPRAFACDYTLVADLLKRVSDSFREHSCLSSSRTVMFDFIGKMMVLQPEAGASFVGGEGHHPLLPPTAGLFLVREPVALSSAAATLKNDARLVQQAVAQAISNLPAAAAAAATGAASPATVGAAAPASKAAQQHQVTRPVSGAREALWVLMNRPHPLDILADPGAYGDSGAISRYHNPDNYTRALGGVLRARGAAWRRLVARAGSAGMRCFAPVLDSHQQRAAAAAAAAAASDGAVAPPAGTAERRLMAPSGGKQSLLPRLSPPRSSSQLT